MKKIILLLIAISTLSFGAGFSIGKEMSLSPKLQIDTEVDIEDRMGIYAEVYQGSIDVQGLPLEAGVGLRLNSFFETSSDKQAFLSTTIYGIARLAWDLNSIKPYIQMRFGYPYAAEGDYISEYNNPSKTFTNDLQGIYYYSAGLGATIKFVDLSVNYDYTTYKLTSTGFDEKNASTSLVSIYAGVKF